MGTNPAMEGLKGYFKILMDDFAHSPAGYLYEDRPDIFMRIWLLDLVYVSNGFILKECSLKIRTSKVLMQVVALEGIINRSIPTVRNSVRHIQEEGVMTTTILNEWINPSPNVFAHVGKG